MKVKDLIAKLQNCNPEADVVLYSEVLEDADAWGGEVSEYPNPQEASMAYYCKGSNISRILQVKTDEIVRSWTGGDGKTYHQYKYVNSENPVVVIS